MIFFYQTIVYGFKNNLESKSDDYFVDHPVFVCLKKKRTLSLMWSDQIYKVHNTLRFYIQTPCRELSAKYEIVAFRLLRPLFIFEVRRDEGKRTRRYSFEGG